MVTFQARTQIGDGAGGFSENWEDLINAPGGYLPQRGREKVGQGRIESLERGVLNVPFSAALAAIGSEHRVLIDGVPYEIHAVSNPDQRHRELEFVIERGGAI